MEEKRGDAPARAPEEPHPTGSPVRPPGMVKIEPEVVLSEPMVGNRVLVGESALGGIVSATTAPIQSPYA